MQVFSYEFILILCFVVISFSLVMSKRQLHDAEQQMRLINLRHQNYISQRALQNVARELQRRPIEHVSRGTQYRARKKLVATRTPFGPLVTEKTVVLSDGTELTLGLSNPLAIMSYQAMHCPSYERIMRNALARHPVSIRDPWNMILYQDGVNPSDGLSNHATRKSAVYYWSILEYGCAELGCEQLWACPTMCRQNQVKKLEGHHSRLAIEFLEQVFDDRVGFGAGTAGFDIQFPNGDTAHLYLKLGVVLADEPAFSELCNCKGHAGSKSCFCCQNACTPNPPGGGRPLSDHSAWFKPLTETRLEAFIYAYIYIHTSYMYTPSACGAQPRLRAYNVDGSRISA